MDVESEVKHAVSGFQVGTKNVWSHFRKFHLALNVYDPQRKQESKLEKGRGMKGTYDSYDCIPLFGLV